MPSLGDTDSRSCTTDSLCEITPRIELGFENLPFYAELALDMLVVLQRQIVSWNTNDRLLLEGKCSTLVPLGTVSSCRSVFLLESVRRRVGHKMAPIIIMAGAHNWCCRIFLAVTEFEGLIRIQFKKM
jgi:hypothetical protein